MSEAEARSIEGALQHLRELIDTARTMPMSASVLVNRDEAIELLERAKQNLPAELRHARWLLKERQEYLEQAKREGNELLESARVQAERMVERSDIVREARRGAQQIIADAEAEARRLQHAAEDYVDQRLSALEGLLERTLSGVRKGRDRLAVQLPTEDEPEEESEDVPVFDQDESSKPSPAAVPKGPPAAVPKGPQAPRST
jgi:F0F1-type ATP synthase membrane subunit b/b'